MTIQTNNYDPAQKYGAETKDPKWNLATYANNAAALAGGLVANDAYKVVTGEVRIVV